MSMELMAKYQQKADEAMQAAQDAADDTTMLQHIGEARLWLEAAKMAGEDKRPTLTIDQEKLKKAVRETPPTPWEFPKEGMPPYRKWGAPHNPYLNPHDRVDMPLPHPVPLPRATWLGLPEDDRVHSATFPHDPDVHMTNTLDENGIVWCGGPGTG